MQRGQADRDLRQPVRIVAETQSDHEPQWQGDGQRGLSDGAYVAHARPTPAQCHQRRDDQQDGKAEMVSPRRRCIRRGAQGRGDGGAVGNGHDDGSRFVLAHAVAPLQHGFGAQGRIHAEQRRRIGAQRQRKVGLQPWRDRCRTPRRTILGQQGHAAQAQIGGQLAPAQAQHGRAPRRRRGFRGVEPPVQSIQPHQSVGRRVHGGEVLRLVQVLAQLYLERWQRSGSLDPQPRETAQIQGRRQAQSDLAVRRALPQQQPVGIDLGRTVAVHAATDQRGRRIERPAIGRVAAQQRREKGDGFVPELCAQLIARECLQRHGHGGRRQQPARDP
ncbi:hypothetical protein ACFJIW_13115 [Tahibacter sp. UC22_41]|uniref:hypothetical protein n=1 Tax=Tahibacter sp. UC22_41 TaxID=3350178 RepID=UPI0036DEE31F